MAGEADAAGLLVFASGHCRCEHCRAAYATYRAQRRATGADPTRGAQPANTDAGTSAAIAADRHIPAPGSANKSGNPPSTPQDSHSTSASTTYATPTHPGYSPAAPTSKPSKTAWATPDSPPPSNTCTPSPTPTTPPSQPSTPSATAAPDRSRQFSRRLRYSNRPVADLSINRGPTGIEPVLDLPGVTVCDLRKRALTC